jgi:hypothetical protein
MCAWAILMISARPADKSEGKVRTPPPGAAAAAAADGSGLETSVLPAMLSGWPPLSNRVKAPMRRTEAAPKSRSQIEPPIFLGFIALLSLLAF